MEGLFNPTTILLHMFNTGLLLAALYFLLYKPVRKFLAKREDAIAGRLDSATSSRHQADQLLSARQEQLDGAAREAADLVMAGEAQGKARAEALIGAAQHEADIRSEKALAQVRAQESNARRALYEEAAQLSVTIAQAALEREVTLADHKRLVDAFLEKAGKIQ